MAAAFRAPAFASNYHLTDHFIAHTTMADFLAHENDILGGEFSAAPTGESFAAASGDIDFDRAASAFPEISLDGSTDIPIPGSQPAAVPTNSGFSFDDFGSPPQPTKEIAVTGTDEIDKFESEFPELDVPAVSLLSGVDPYRVPTQLTSFHHISSRNLFSCPLNLVSGRHLPLHHAHNPLPLHPPPF